MATKTMNCPRCAGTGIYTGYGVCFRCEGAQVVAYRKPSAVNLTPRDYIPIDAVFGGRGPQWFTPREGVGYAAAVGIQVNILEVASIQLAWSRGKREIRNPRLTGLEHLPRYR